MSYATKDIRNVALLGHGSTGKTTLAENMLFVTGAIDRQGKVTDGNTVCDYDAEEIKRQFTISLSVAPVNYGGAKINVVDCPGFFDFAGEVSAALRAVECGIVFCTAKDGITVGAERSWKLLKEANKPVAFYVSKCDEEHGDFEGGLVEGIDDALAPVAYECVGHGVHLHLSGGGDRLDANDGVHRLFLPFGGTVLPVMGGRGMGGNLGVEYIGPKEVALPQDAAGIEGDLGARHLVDGLRAVHDLEEVALDLAHAVLGRDGTAHVGDLAGPRLEELLAACIVGSVARKHVDMQVVVADVAPHGALQTRLGQSGAVHLHDLVQACVGHGHVASELGDGGVGLAALALAAVTPAFAQEVEEEEGPIGFTPVAIGLATPVQLPSKNSMALAQVMRPRAAQVKSMACCSCSKKQLTPHVTAGAARSSSSISQMTPRVPSLPTNRSTASMPGTA